MLRTFDNVLETLIVHEDRMRSNLDLTLGLVFSQRVLLSLLQHGVERETAYEMVRRNANQALDQQIDFQYLILQDAEICTVLDREEIMDLFNYEYHMRNIDYIFKRAEI